MTREEFLNSVDEISTEVNDLHKQITTINGMITVLKQSTKENDLAMHNLLSLIENNMNEVLDTKLNKISKDISKVLAMGKNLEDKPVRTRKPRTNKANIDNKSKQTRTRQTKNKENNTNEIKEATKEDVQA